MALVNTENRLNCAVYSISELRNEGKKCLLIAVVSTSYIWNI